MRSTRRELDAVVAKFERWRAKRQGRAIPGELWDAAIRLLDGHRATAICRALRLNHRRFLQMREARGALPGGGVARRRAASAVMPSASGGFLELAPPGLGLLDGMRPRVEPTHGRTGCRLSVETAAGTLSVVTAAPAPALVETVCRFVLGALGDGSRA